MINLSRSTLSIDSGATLCRTPLFTSHAFLFEPKVHVPTFPTQVSLYFVFVLLSLRTIYFLACAIFLAHHTTNSSQLVFSLRCLECAYDSPSTGRVGIEGCCKHGVKVELSEAAEITRWRRVTNFKHRPFAPGHY